MRTLTRVATTKSFSNMKEYGQSMFESIIQGKKFSEYDPAEF